MKRYEFPSKLKTNLLIMMAVGVLSMIVTYLTDDALHTRFWSNFLHNASFFTGMSIMALFFYCANVVAFSGWYTVFKRLWESYFTFLIPGFALMLIFGLSSAFGLNHIYHWGDPAEVAKDPILIGKSRFLNFKIWFILTIVAGVLWIFIARKIRSLSLSEDSTGTIKYNQHNKMRIWSAIVLPLIGFLSAGVIWLWIMSVDAHWYSTMFAWYSAVSWIAAMVALTIMMLVYLKGKGYYEFVTIEHIHDLGKWLFAFSIFWAYLWFSQYMLIWYANIGEETVYFKTRMDQYPILFWGNLIMNFVLPFLILLRNDTKRKYGSLLLVCGIVFFGHWFDFFNMIKPGTIHTAHEILAQGGGHLAEAVDAHGAHGGGHETPFLGNKMPGFLDIGSMIGFLGLYLYISFASLTKGNLAPSKDPYFEESLHHHV